MSFITTKNITPTLIVHTPWKGSFDLLPFDLYINCGYWNKWKTGGLISLPREERLVRGGIAGSGSRGVKVGHFSWEQIERVRFLIYKGVHIKIVFLLCVLSLMDISMDPYIHGSIGERMR